MDDKRDISVRHQAQDLDETGYYCTHEAATSLKTKQRSNIFNLGSFHLPRFSAAARWVVRRGTVVLFQASCVPYWGGESRWCQHADHDLANERRRPGRGWARMSESERRCHAGEENIATPNFFLKIKFSIYPFSLKIHAIIYLASN